MWIQINKNSSIREKRMIQPTNFNGCLEVRYPQKWCEKEPMHKSDRDRKILLVIDELHYWVLNKKAKE